MPRYNCPVKTCNVNFTGAVYEIVPRAVGHALGSHQDIIDETDVREEIERQANPQEPQAKRIDLDKWWKKINDKS